MKYTVIRDTREKQGWEFGETKYCAGTVDKALKTGDYTLAGYENSVCIERKGSVEEIALNLMSVRFIKEMVRIKPYRHKYIVMEFSLYDLLTFPKNSRIPVHKRPKRYNGYTLLKKLVEIELYYDVHIIYAGNSYYAQDYVTSLFKRITNNSYEEKVNK